MQTRNYTTKKKGKTEVYPFRSMEDIKAMIDYFKAEEDWDSYLTFMFGILMGRRIGDTLSMKWSDLYYENGKCKSEITTIEEQKTGKTTTIYISGAVWDSVNLYVQKTNVKPMDKFNDYIFQYGLKTEWVNRKDSEVYNHSSYADEELNYWCEYFRKDFSETRKEKILKGFKDDKDYSSLGDYLYYEVEYMDIVKWQQDAFRRKLAKAVEYVGIEYNVSTHSLRKTFGLWSSKIHPYDADKFEILQKIFNHSDIQTTMCYIGLTGERIHKYFDDMGEFVTSVENGNSKFALDNSPVISLKSDDLREIISNALKAHESIDEFNKIMKLVEEKRISDK